MKRKLVAVVLFAFVSFMGYVASRPDGFKVTRSVAIAAPPAAVYAHVADLRRWEAWSPWGKLDPAMARTYGGPSAGVGQTYHWKGNSKVGEGRMEIKEALPPGRVAIELEFLKPWASRNATALAIATVGTSTTVTWSMDGSVGGFAGKLFSVFADFDATVGKDFEAGLAALKTLAEADARSAGVGAGN